MPLTKPSVSAAHTEQSAQELLNEFFKAHFNGSDPNADFPKADILFNQANLPDAQPNPQIHCLFLAITPQERAWSKTQRLVQSPATLALYIRVANKGSNDNTADFTCRRVADNVKSLFQSEARSDLAQRGILNPRVRKGPTVAAAVAHQTRLLVVTCTFRYLITVA